MAYQVYGPRKTRTFRVLWLLEELGVAYAHYPEAPRSQAVRSVSPSGKVPVLVADGVSIPDSAAILTFLADRHGRFTEAAGTVPRGRQDGWTQRVLDEIDAVLWTAARHTFILPEAERVPAVKATCRAEYARSIARICEEMAGPFLMGEEMTVPDILLGHCGGWAMVARFPEAPPEFADYLKRLRARPAFQRAAAL